MKLSTKCIIISLYFLFIASCNKVNNELSIEYTVGISEKSSQNYNIKMLISGNIPATLNLSMPVWTPGDYKLQNFARYVMNFNVKDGQNRLLHYKRIDANTWQVESNNNSSITVEYDLSTKFDNKLGLSTAGLDSLGGYFTGTCIFLCLKEYINNPVFLSFNLPNEWKVVSPLPSVGSRRFKANNYHYLVDSPVEVGHFLTKSLSVGEIECIFVFNRDLNYDEEKFNSNVRKVVNCIANDIFKNAPFKKYYFFFHWKPEIDFGGGMEHGESVVMNIGKYWMPDLTDNAIITIAHEFFHAWNVKRIRPKEFYPYNYFRMNETSFLWFFEGITYYYTIVVSVRSGIITGDRFLRSMAGNITDYEELNRDYKMSIEESSLIEYIKPVQANDAEEGGIIMGFLLDIIIREATDNEKSFDDVMRTLDKRFGEKKIGYTKEDIVRIISEITGEDMNWFFDKYISGTETIAYSDILSKAGLSIRLGQDKDGDNCYFIEPSQDQTIEQKKILDGILQNTK